MTKISLKAILWGVISWLALSFLLFFGIGFYQGLVGEEKELSSSAMDNLRYLVLLLSLNITAIIFILGEKKEKPFRHIVDEEKPTLTSRKPDSIFRNSP